MIPEYYLYILCGLIAGLLGGYLGLGGGIVMVPFLTVVLGIDIKAAVPVSVSAMVVNSFSASNEYLKKGMVDLELVVILCVFTISGNIIGSSLSTLVPAEITRTILTVVLIYTAFSLLKSKNNEDKMSFLDSRFKYIVICSIISLFTGIIASLVGIGGGVIIVPVLYLIIGLPLSTSRGTSSLMIGFSATAAAVVYLLNDQIDFKIASGVILGIILGGKLGGYLGTMAKPLIVKIIFVILMLYLAFKLSYQSLEAIL